MASNQGINSNRAVAGLNTDNIIGQIEPGYVTDALNAINGSFDGHQVSYQNEEGNILCVTIPEGYKCIGVKNVMQISQVWYFITNPSTGYSMIGYVQSNSCQFVPVIDDSTPGSDLLNFNIHHPIHKIEVKSTNCSTEFYWTDKYNHRRYLDINNLPWQTGLPGVLDTNKMDVQPTFSIPTITPESVSIGGNIVEGCYQFAVQYANVYADGLTSFYSVTNPVRIFLDNKISADYNLATNYAIEVVINDLDTTGLYEYFNLVVIKTINAVTTVELVGTYNIQSSDYRHVYTGLEQSNANVKLTLSDVMTQFDYYDLAGTLTQVDNLLVWADLVKEEDISFQQIANQVKVYWATSQVPIGQKQGYENGIVCAQVEGYFRDETYALGLTLLFDNGKQSTDCHLPGRTAEPYDLEIISNADADAIKLTACPTPNVERWKVYNTATRIDYLPGATDVCTGIKPWEYGTMAYTESEEVYPANIAIWGSLAGQKIRHHKFPDCLVSPIHDENYIYPLGIKIDVNSLIDAIQTSSLTDAQKRSIVGYKITRADRVGNKSIIAKGVICNMGKYTKNSVDYLYPNYPLNDVRPDPFISSTYVNDNSGVNGTTLLNDFQKNRFTFHSPDTHFYQPSGIQNSLFNIETAEYGICKAHFVQVEDNAREKILTPNALTVAVGIAALSTFGLDVDRTTGTQTTVSITPTFHPQNFITGFNNTLEIIDKLTPWYNYGWQYNGVANYVNTKGIPNDLGNKVRYINYGGYINPGLQGSLGDIYSINNTGRESSVYLSLNDNLPYTHEQVDKFGVNLNIPVDTSRTTASAENVCGTSAPFYKNSSMYYGSIKRYLLSQYGTINSYRIIDTGANVKLFDQGVYIQDAPIVYGGDCFINRFALKIKHPFFLKSTVNRPDGFDIDYNQDEQSNTNTGNVGYPIYYYSTTNQTITLSSFTSGQITNLVNSFTTTGGLLTTLISVGIIPIGLTIAIIGGLIADGLFGTLALKITNLDCYSDAALYETGMSYLYAYGIPYYFCESEVNVDMRQATNDREGNFYPNVSTDIPDQWLQETFVPIAFDNTYNYNKTYSKQNHETAFTVLRPNWEPGQQCYVTYNNRAIWSEGSDMEGTRNNWLVYKPANIFDFPKSFGELVAIDRLESRAVMVRYVNHTQLYNAQATIETTAINATLGTGALFSGTQPIDFNLSDSGYAGTQHKFLLQTENGHIFVDAMRGQIILVRGTAIEEISNEKYHNSKWFLNNLPFNLIKYFPTYPIDNHFNGIGLHGVYDDYYKRLIITKIDYIPLNDVQYDGTNFFVYDNTYDNPFNPNGEKVIIQLGDPNYFCNKSWTISFSFLSNSWISWHSYIPNFYVQNSVGFQSGKNDTVCTVWNHNQTFTLFNNFYGQDYPYIIEYPFSYEYLDQLLQYVEEYMTVLQYNEDGIYIEPNDTIYFTQAIVYNKQASTGLLNLIPKDINNRAQYFSYPKYNSDSIDVLVTKVDHMYSYNMIWNNLSSPNLTQWLNNCTPSQGSKTLNQTNFDYSVKSFKKYPLRAKDTLIREMANRTLNPYKMISKFIVAKTQNMIS